MPSTFSWLDHSDRDRRRVLDAIDRFTETDTRDELGLGALRDGFADLFFPGTSTIQTRARYFLFIPWVYRSVEARASADNLVARLRKEEVQLRDALTAAGEDDRGIIGKRAGAATKRMPSSIYWSGLKTWNIRVFPGSQQTFHSSFSRRKQQAAAGGARDDDGERIDGGGRHAWHPHLPPAPAGFPEAASFKLTAEEAHYLVERITFAAGDSLLAFLAQHAHSLDADLPWAHPQFAEFPRPVRDALEHARLLAETSEGAALLYNLMLAEELPPGAKREEFIDRYRGRWQAWATELSGRDAAVSRWSRDAFWALIGSHANVRTATRQFVDTWIDLEPWKSPSDSLAEARSLIWTRERKLKGSAHARLGNPRALELWGGEAGTARFSYRWGPAVRLLRDIHAALKTGSQDA